MGLCVSSPASAKQPHSPGCSSRSNQSPVPPVAMSPSDPGDLLDVGAASLHPSLLFCSTFTLLSYLLWSFPRCCHFSSFLKLLLRCGSSFACPLWLPASLPQPRACSTELPSLLCWEGCQGLFIPSERPRAVFLSGRCTLLPRSPCYNPLGK